jgi:enamine deaminase RidA (YjgF/YER057c/UK114 family)
MERFGLASVAEPADPAQIALAGSTLYLAGLTAPVERALDCAQQADHIWQQIGQLLRAAGAGYHDIFRVVTYLVDIRDQPTALRVRQQYLGDHRPVSTLVGVAALEQPGQLIQIEITARQPARAKPTTR